MKPDLHTYNVNMTILNIITQVGIKKKYFPGSNFLDFHGRRVKLV